MVLPLLFPKSTSCNFLLPNFGKKRILQPQMNSSVVPVPKWIIHSEIETRFTGCARNRAPVSFVRVRWPDRFSEQTTNTL
jgi:hypothetical protein